MTEHVQFKDIERHKIVCAKCGLPWPCEPKKSEILAKIRLDVINSKMEATNHDN